MGIGQRISAGVTSPAFFAAIPLLAAVYDAYGVADQLSIGWFFGDLVPRLGLALVVSVPVYGSTIWLLNLFLKFHGASDAAQTARRRFAVSHPWMKRA